jgi:hypothetical protein
MGRRDDWLAFWVTIIVIALGFFVFDPAEAERIISTFTGSPVTWSTFSWDDIKFLVGPVLLVLVVYTLLGVVRHIIHIRVD